MADLRDSGGVRELCALAGRVPADRLERLPRSAVVEALLRMRSSEAAGEAFGPSCPRWDSAL
ncbi:hypothetical protein ACFYWY_34145 [Streptomyces sp. NPDC002870]|uniref:hypothetical protein n=1 Tax=Streptomyces sp. NPDC002870 TaxID=3364666 RepID=UPI0036740B04